MRFLTCFQVVKGDNQQFVKKEEGEDFEAAFPQLSRYASAYQLWQKVLISRYYKRTASYWHDFDPYLLSESLGQDRLKINDPYFLNSAFHPLAWDPAQWDGDMVPIWQQPWAIRWDIFEHHLLHLLSHQKIDQAQRLIRLYQPHFNEEYQSAYAPFFELQLAVAMAAGDSEQVASLSDNLIGITEDYGRTSYWGHYFKATSLMEKGDIRGAIQLMLPVVHRMDLDSDRDDKDLQAILALLNTIARQHPALLDSESMHLLQVARVHLN